MTHKPIQIKSLSLSFPQKLCFADFNAQIYPGARIAIIGQNGSGKSTLLKILAGVAEPTSGFIQHAHDLVCGYVPQLYDSDVVLSGSQQLNQALTRALSVAPNLLLLDEPTNHLDQHNRRSLLRMLQAYTGTLLVVSHDLELLKTCVDNIWHVERGNITIFSGNYQHYLQESSQQRKAIEQALSQLNRQKKQLHCDLMQEQKRAAKSRAKGEKSIEQRKWPTVISKTKVLRAQETSGRKKVALDTKKQDLSQRLAALSIPEVIVPNFSLQAEHVGQKVLVSIQAGSISYPGHEAILSQIYLTIHARQRLALLGDNASGKSSLAKAILNIQGIVRKGEWVTPSLSHIGYLDQQYQTLLLNKTVYDNLADFVPHWNTQEIRKHLQAFLFRKHEDVNLLANQLSGGERVRLCLAQIAAKTPKLLILDEVTNNLDLETKQHVIEVLQTYPGALLVISHDDDFIRAINVNDYYHIENNTVNVKISV